MVASSSKKEVGKVVSVELVVFKTKQNNELIKCCNCGGVGDPITMVKHLRKQYGFSLQEAEVAVQYAQKPMKVHMYDGWF